MKRLLAVFLSVLMVLSCFGAIIAAAEPEPEPEPEEPDFYVELSVDGEYFYGEPFKVHAVVKDIKPGTALTSVEFTLWFDENYLSQSNSIYDIAVNMPGDSWENLSGTSWSRICVSFMTVDETEAATQDGDLEFEIEFTCWSEYNYDLEVFVEEARGSDADFNDLAGEGNRISLERGGRIKPEEIESVEIIRNAKNSCLYEGARYITGLHSEYDEGGNLVTWHGDYYDYYDGSIIVTLKDGTLFDVASSVGAIYSAAEEDGTWYTNDYTIRGEIYTLKYSDDQKKDDPWKAGIHTVHCDFEGFEFDYDVEILECPVTSLTVEPLEIIEGDGRNVTNVYDYDAASWVSINAYYYEHYVRWTAVLKDGTVLSQDGRYYNGAWIDPVITDDQVKSEWTVGNTYTAKANVLGFTADFEVSVIDTPIDRIEIEPIEIIEYTCGYEDYAYVGEDRVDYYYYSELAPESGTVYFKDGTQAELNNNCVEYKGKDYYGSYAFVSPQDGEHIWTAGNTYKARYELLGCAVEYDIGIIKSPFVSAEAEPVVLAPEVNGSWDCTYDDSGNRVYSYCYDLGIFNVTVHLSDGSEISGVNSVEYNGKKYWLDYNIDQYDTPMTAGNTYKFDGEICGLPLEISVTVEETPIERIEFGELKLPVNSQGYYTTDDYGQEYFCYDYSVPEYTVYFKDGNSVSSNGRGFEYGGTWYEIRCFEDFQYFTHWEEGWSYDVEVGVGGYRGSFRVEITEFPIVSVTASDVEVTAYTGGEFVKLYDGGNVVDRFYYYSILPEFTVTFSNGDSLTTDETWFEYEGIEYGIDFSFDQYATHMEPGGSYTVNGSVGSVEFSFNVNVVVPFTSVSAEDVYLLEGETDYYYPEITAVYTDGTAVRLNARGFSRSVYGEYGEYDCSITVGFEDGEGSFEVYVADGQTDGGPLAPGDYTVSAMLAGTEFTFVLHVVESPVASISVEPVYMFEHARGYWNTRWDPDKGEYVPYFEYNLPAFKVHAVFKDGSEADISGVYEYMGKQYSVSYSYYSQYNDPWELGGSYDIEVRFLGAQTTASVTIIETPVQSMVVEPVTLIENINGCWDKRWDETAGDYVEFFVYDLPGVKATVTFKDGSTAEVGGSGYEYEGVWYNLGFRTPDQYAEPFAVGGDYVGTASFMGFEATFAINVIKTPVKSMTIDPVSQYAYTNGWWSRRLNGVTGEYEEYYCYYVPTLSATVTFMDGTVAEIVNNYEYNGSICYLECELPDQQEEPMLPGHSYTARGSFLGFDAEVAVTILESPVESITVEPITIVEKCFGYWYQYWDDYAEEVVEIYIYELPPVTARVLFKDGTEVECFEGMTYEGEYYGIDYDVSSQYENTWEPGNTYEVKVALLGCLTTVAVTVVESPVESVTVPRVDVPASSAGTQMVWDCVHEEYVQYPYFDEWSYKPATITINFKDGTSAELEKFDHFEYLGASYGFSVSSDQSFENSWHEGNTYEATLSVLGFETTFEVRILEKPVYGEADGFTYMLQNGEITVTGCMLNGETIAIPETLGGYPVTAVSGLGYGSATKKITVPDSVKKLGEDAFRGRFSVTEIVIGAGAEEMYTDTFGFLPDLERITVSPDNAFFSDDGGILYNKTGDKLVAYPLGQGDVYTVPKNVTNIDAMRNYYYEGVKIVFEDGNENFVKMDGVTYNKDMTEILFVDSDKTGEYVMPDTVTAINGAFREQSGITRIVISENVTELVYMEFMGCTALESVEFPENLKAIGGGAFYGCTSLKSVELPYVDDIGYGVFSGCTSLTEAAIDEEYGYIPSGLFAYCSSLENFTIAENITIIGADAFKGTAIKEITLPEKLKYIGGGAFSYTPLGSAELPEELEAIGNGAFRNTKLTELVIPDSVSMCGAYVLAYCKDLRSCTLSNQMRELPFGFFEGSGLTSFTVPEQVEYVDDSAFAYCVNLTAVEFANPCTNLGASAFEGCGITDIALPEESEFIGMYCFADSGLKSARIPANVTELTYSMFRWCADLGEVTIPGSVETISEAAFQGAGLKTVRYIGDEEGWDLIDIGEKNEPLLNAERIYIAQLESEGVIGQLLRSEYDSEVTLVVNKLDKSGYSAEGVAITDVYEVYFAKAGVRITPSEGVRVLLPVPDGIAPAEAALVTFDGANNAETVGTVLNGGMLAAGTTGVFAIGRLDTKPDVSVTYTVRFVDWDGTVISEKQYAEGDSVVIPADPSRAEDDKNTYTFTGWDKAVAANAAADATYTAVYESKPKQLPYIPGDVNGNGKIDAADYAMCKRAFLKTYTLSDEQLMRADINKNGKVDASEYAMIKRHFLKTYTIPGAEGK